MKKLTYLILTLLITATIFSCTKTAAVLPLSIQGKWTLKLDSLAQGVSVPSPQYSSKYAGTASDYFDFRSDNKLYIKEGAKLDTFSYQLNADSSVYISSPETNIYGIASSLNGTIKPLSESSATIHFTPAVASFGAYYSRTVNLTK